ncbi:reverse transcriptase domain-containing protein [Tanacetum coccineum]
MCIQEGFPLDDIGRRSIPGNEETNSGAANINSSQEGGRPHGLPISGQRSSQCRSTSREKRKTNLNPLQFEAYGIKYTPRSAIKGQVIADLLVDTMAEDSPTQAKTDGPDDTLAEGESTEEQEATETKAPKNLKAETDIWKLYTDGASNDHGSGAGLILIDPEGAEYSYAFRLNFANSNNDAKYEALLAGLRITTKIKVEKMHAFVDLKLVANQISHIPREENRKADTLSKLAVVQCEGLTKGVLIEELNERSVDMAEVNAIIEDATGTWMTPIQEYIEKGILPEDATEARTIREKTRNYTIEDGVLYRKSYLGPLFRCIGPQQAKYLIREIHMGSCGMHGEPKRTVYKAMNAGCFWPSMHRDANNEISSCDSCQWGMDIVGPFLEASGRIKYLIVAVDYFTKWLEAKPASPQDEQSRDPDKENEEALKLNLNLLEERREIAAIREARRKQQVEKYYNQRVHHKEFKVGEFVLRKNELSKVENTDKLRPKWEGPYEVVETYDMGTYKLRSIKGAEIPRTWHSSNLRKYYM